ncbi:amidohydrolase family protein [Sulfurisphaera javensis]|uniref:Amidohydrolase family protein n=1 Tax=Sulfurisphaera javensis TaxID=2049879 RepID=A0AAT9GRK0_9CREN
MSNLRINLGGILLGEELELKENVNVELSENNEILHVGNGYDSSAIDMRQFIMLPPLINAHTHIADFTFPEIGIDKSIKELVGDPNSEKYKYLKIYSNKIIDGIKNFVIKSLKFGIVGLIDFREEGIIGIVKAKNALKEFVNIRYYALGRLDSFDEKELDKLSKIADGYGLPDLKYHNEKELTKIYQYFSVKIRAVHVAETKKQYIRDNIENLISIYSPNLVIHGTHFTEDEFNSLKEKEIPIVFCPRSNLWFGVGVPNIALAYDSGVSVLFGSDNGSWISPNLWKDLELALLITRIQRPGSNYAKNILLSVTVNSYKLLNIDLSIKEGNRTYPILIKGEEIFQAHEKYVAIIKRASDNGIYSLGAIQNIS